MHFYFLSLLLMEFLNPVSANLETRLIQVFDGDGEYSGKIPKNIGISNIDTSDCDTIETAFEQLLNFI